jgi:integrase
VREKLTKSLIEARAPAKRPFEIRDTEQKGLLLRVQPSGIRAWYYDYRHNGVRNRRLLGRFPDLSPDGARKVCLKLAARAADGVDVQAEKKAARVAAERAKVSTLGAFIEKQYGPWALEHLRRGDVAIARLRADFGKWLEDALSAINVWRVESWRRERLKAGTKPVTLNRQIDTLRAALAKAVEWKVIEAHPLKGLKRIKVDDDERVRYLSPAEENRLRDALVVRETKFREARERFNQHREARHKEALPKRTEEFVDHLRPLVLTAINTGLRRGELFSLRCSDINLDTKILTVRAAAAKSGDSRRVPLNAEAETVLGRWLKQTKGAGNAFVFPGADGTRLTNVNKAWATVCKLAKLRDFRFHDCRHHFGSRLVQKGVDLNTVRELMGHADLKMTLRYSHLAPDNLRAAVDRLAG